MAEYDFAKEYLTKRGWQAEKDGFFAEWIDPADSSGHNFRAAVRIQTSRDARRLGTALAALELAEPLLTDYRKYLISAGQPGYGEVTEALATVRAAKEGRDI